MKKMILVFATMVAIVGCGVSTPSEVMNDTLTADSVVVVVDSSIVVDSTKSDSTIVKDSLTK